MSSFKIDAIEAPESSSQALRPTTSVLTSRYESTRRVTPTHTTIAPGLFCYAGEREPEYLPLGWSACNHPEGQLYFACNATLRIVTEAYMYSARVQEKVAHWTQVISDILGERDIRLPDTAELFLQMDDESDSCLYYFVDHAAQTEFWIEELPTDFLDLPAVVSDSHLRLVLEELYWNHIEHFPSHRFDQLSLRIDELTHVFVHARADHMTSEFSTFPYGAEECMNFLSVIQTAKDCSNNAYSVSVISRLWVVIAHHRFSTHYGQEHARLSRDQSILDAPEVHRRWLFASISRLLFAVPESYTQQLDELYVDNVVYATQWRAFAHTCREEWKLYASWAFALMIINILLLLIPHASRTLALSSALLSNGAIISAVALLVRHQRAGQWVAAEAATYLADARGDASGFQRMAVAFALPKALFLWALGVASAQGLLWLLLAASASCCAAAAGLGVAALVLVLCARAALARAWEGRPRFALWRAGGEAVSVECGEV